MEQHQSEEMSRFFVQPWITDEAAVMEIGSALARDIEGIMKGQVLRQEMMARHTSFGVGGPADLFLLPSSAEETARVADYLASRGIPFFPLGRGTNLLVLDGGYRGVILCLKNLQGLEVRSAGSGEVLLRGEAGLTIARLVDFAAGESLEGLEFLAGIPGTVGGAARMNAGAWGSEIKDVTSSLTVIVPGAGAQEIPRSRLSFTYRNLDLPGQGIIVAADLLVRRGLRDDIEKRTRGMVDLRKERHPLEYRSAGSIFKNPPGDVPAGRLIDEAGLKGLTIGDAAVSERHGNFIVNRGEAKASHIADLIDRVKRHVLERTGVELETEVITIGENP